VEPDSQRPPSHSRRPAGHDPADLRTRCDARGDLRRGPLDRPQRSRFRPNWAPLVATANDPSHPGAHSAIGAASAVVLSSIFGPKFDFAVTSSALPGVERSFQAAAEEAGLSRIFASVHTRLDHVAGQQLGTRAHFVVDNLLTPRGRSER
jgi:hypothetical protein